MNLSGNEIYPPVGPNLIQEVVFRANGSVIDRIDGEWIGIDHDMIRGNDEHIGRDILEYNVSGGTVSFPVAGTTTDTPVIVDLPFWFRGGGGLSRGLPIHQLIEDRHEFLIYTRQQVRSFSMIFEVSDLPRQEIEYMMSPGVWSLDIISRTRMLIDFEAREKMPIILPFTEELVGIVFGIRPVYEELSGNYLRFSGLSQERQDAESVPYASGNTQAAVYCSGMYVSNVQIQLPLDGVATEQLTLVGDTRKWLGSSNPIAANLGADRHVIGSGAADSAYQRWTLDKNNSTLPVGISGYPVQSINVTMAIGREVIQELGTRGKYCRYATFPFEVTSEFEVIAGKHRDGTDGVSGNDQALIASGYDFRNYASYACASDNKYDITAGVTPASVDSGEIDVGYRDQEIKVKLCGATGSDSLTIDLGTKNRVTSVNYAGGDTGGGNVTLTYSFQNYNYLKLDGAGSYANDPEITFA